MKLLKNLALACLAGYIAYPQISGRISLYSANSEVINKILSQCPSLNNQFKPTWWLFSGPLQLLFGSTSGSIEGKSKYCDDVSYSRERVFLPDSGIISIDWLLPEVSNSYNAILVIVPGMTGSSGSQYVRCLALEGKRRGFRIAVVQGRGIGGTPIKVFYI